MVGVRGLGRGDKCENVCMWLLHVLQTDASVCGLKIPLRICSQIDVLLLLMENWGEELMWRLRRREKPYTLRRCDRTFT